MYYSATYYSIILYITMLYTMVIVCYSIVCCIWIAAISNDVILEVILRLAAQSAASCGYSPPCAQ